MSQPKENRSESARTTEMERLEFVSRRRLPAVLYASEAAHVLNVHVDDIAVLVMEKLIRPLGRLGDSDHNRFAACAILKATEDSRWLDKMSRAIYAHRRPGKGSVPPLHAPDPSSKDELNPLAACRT